MTFYLEPQGQVTDYKTYQVSQPKTEKTRIASCQAAGCERYELGFRTTVPMLSAAAGYIRNQSGRKFRENVVDGMAVFTFYPGQQCFEQHHVPDRPQFFIVKDGDHRGNPTGRRRMHTNGKYWVEDFAEHQANLADRLEKG